MEKHPLHIKHPELQTSADVQKAVKRQERLTGKRVPNEPGEAHRGVHEPPRERLLHPDTAKRERNIDMLRPRIYDALLIKRENFPESYFELQKRVARERGQAVEEIPEAVREQMMDVAIQDQRASLDAWIDYLSSNDAVYPPWFKYYAFTQITKLSQFDKERGEFKKRTDTTVAPFPDIYREPLAQIADIYEKVKADNKNLKEPEIREALSKKFPALYAELISKSLAATAERSEQIKGSWVKYQKGKPGEAEKLFRSLDGKGTGWCTAGQSTSVAQIQSGDFHVYYTNDLNGDPTQPRLAIRMEGHDRIGEVRGVLPHQGVEPILQETFDEKLKTFGKEADAYRKKSSDMKRLTAIDAKVQESKPSPRTTSTSSTSSIQRSKGSGMREIPASKSFDQHGIQKRTCSRSSSARKTRSPMFQVRSRKNTKAYVGQLEPGIFKKITKFNVEHVYTSFPRRSDQTRDHPDRGKTAKQLEEGIADAGMNLSDYAKEHDGEQGFFNQQSQEDIDLVRLSVKDLGFTRSATTDQLYKRP